MYGVLFKKKINQNPAGPTDEKRAKGKTYIWGKANNAAGKEVIRKMLCADGYTVTAIGCLIITQKILSGNYKAGYQTPAGCYGKDLIYEIPGSAIIS